MSRRMSCSLTVNAVRDRTKTVTRRHVDTWRNLAKGDRLTLVEKAMGLPKGTKQRELADVEVVDVRVEPVWDITDDDVIAEGFPNLTPGEFCDMWLDSHGYGNVVLFEDVRRIPCRRIEWRYLDEAAQP